MATTERVIELIELAHRWRRQEELRQFLHYRGVNPGSVAEAVESLTPAQVDECLRHAKALEAGATSRDWYDAAASSELDRLRKAETLLHRIMGNECIPLDAEEQYRALYPPEESGSPAPAPTTTTTLPLSPEAHPESPGKSDMKQDGSLWCCECNDYHNNDLH